MTTITQVEQPQLLPQPLHIETAIHAIASKLLQSPHIPKEMHETILTWEKTIFSHGVKRAPYAVADVVCRVLWPLLSDDRQKARALAGLQNEVEDILNGFFGVKDPEKFIDAYADILQKATLVVAKDDGMSMLFEEAHALLLRCAQAADDERIALYQKLQRALGDLSQMRSTMTGELHAKLDALNAKVAALQRETLKTVQEAESVTQKVMAIRLVSGENAHAVTELAKKVTK